MKWDYNMKVEGEGKEIEELRIKMDKFGKRISFKGWVEK